MRRQLQYSAPWRAAVCDNSQIHSCSANYFPTLTLTDRAIQTEELNSSEFAPNAAVSPKFRPI